MTTTRPTLVEEDASHCKDCCCARSWKALGVTAYGGKSIAEHIEALRAANAELTRENEKQRVEISNLGERMAGRQECIDELRAKLADSEKTTVRLAKWCINMDFSKGDEIVLARRILAREETDAQLLHKLVRNEATAEDVADKMLARKEKATNYVEAKQVIPTTVTHTVSEKKATARSILGKYRDVIGPELPDEEKSATQTNITAQQDDGVGRVASGNPVSPDFSGVDSCATVGGQK